MSGKMYRASSPLTAQLQCTCGAAWWLVTEAASGEFVCPTTNLFTDEAAPASKPLCFHVTVYVGRLRPAQWDTSLLLTLSPLDVWPKQIYKTSKCSVCTTVTGLGWDYFSLNWPIIGGQEGYREGLWNELPLNLKHISSSSAFKRNLRNYQLSLYWEYTFNCCIVVILN